ncbi:MAG: PEP-CTERM sorting domain-containing protein [Crocosphaera sp.]
MVAKYLSFDLGSVITTTRLALWDGSSATRNITAFEVYSDDDGDFGNGGTTLLGSFNPTTSVDAPSLAQVFDFTDATTQFIHFNITANAGNAAFTTLGEVAFEEGEATPPACTPEPSSLIGLAAIGGSFLLRKRVKQG